MQQIDRYIHHILEDLKLARANFKADNLLVEFSGKKKSGNGSLYLKREIKISEISGIKINELPVHSQISEDIAFKLNSSITDMLKLVNIIPDFPPRLPEVVKYQLIRDYWETKFTISNKEHHIDFCHYHPDNCPYTEYCNICNELDDEN